MRIRLQNQKPNPRLPQKISRIKPSGTCANDESFCVEGTGDFEVLLAE
jgi:hypothetical protein